MKRIIGVIVAPVLLASCAGQQASRAQDDGDQLYLKYAEIAQRPSPMNSDETEETATIMDRINTSSDKCTSWKALKLFPVSVLMLAGGFTPITYDELQDKKDDARRDLKNLQNPEALGDHCPGRGFPLVQIN